MTETVTTETATIHVPVTRLDIGSSAIATDPWGPLRDLRAQGPVIWHETLKRWLVTTDREVRKTLINFSRYTVEGTVVEDLFGADAFIAMDDRKRHDALRNVWADAFRQKGLDALQPAIKAIVDQLLAPVIARLRGGEIVDLSSAVCRPLPTMVIALLMGVPDDAIPDVVRWSDAMAGGAGTYLSDEQAKIVRAARDDAKVSLAGLLHSLLALRRKTPGADLISTLVHSEPAQHLSDEQLVQNVRQLLFAGNETTAKWLAQIFVSYGEDAATRRVLAADRSLVIAANDEVMRLQPPVGTVVRRVRGGPIELAGIELADGDNITCIVTSANRDSARYDDPDKFDIRRQQQPNLGFGVGFHNCLGSMLAKMEAEVAVNELLAAVPDFAVAAPYHYASLAMRGPLPVMVAIDRA